MPAGRSCSPLTGSASSGCSQRCAPPHAMGVVALGGLSTAVVLPALLMVSLGDHRASAEPATAEPRPWMDASLPRARRLADLVGSLTTAEKLTQLVHKAPGVPRIGLPPYVYSGTCNHGEAGPNGPKGPRISTVFPQSLALAETWDLEGIHAVARATADEARAEYNAGYRPGMHSWGPKCDADSACAGCAA